MLNAKPEFFDQIVQKYRYTATLARYARKLPMILISLFAVLLFSLVNGAWLLHRIKNSHPAVWKELGQPTFALSTGVRPRLSLVLYIWALRFRGLNDSALSLACWAAIASEFILVLALLLFAFILGFTY